MRAIRMVLDHERDYPSRRATVVSSGLATPPCGSPCQRLQLERPPACRRRPQPSSPLMRAGRRAADLLEREVHGLRQANEAQRKASAAADTIDMAV